MFGQNLQARVVSSHGSDDDKTESETECASTNGTSDMLFSSALKETGSNEASSSATPRREAKSLSEAAREYEESHSVKRKYEEVLIH